MLAVLSKRFAELVEQSIEEKLAYYGWPENHWVRISTNNPLERIIRAIRRRTRVVGAFSGRPIAVDAVRGPSQACRRSEMGNAALSQHGAVVQTDTGLSHCVSTVPEEVLKNLTLPITPRSTNYKTPAMSA